MQSAPLIIFTDLDGTLLDHHSYSWQAARPALQQLRERQIPLILCTSKTAAEVSQLHAELELTTPFIIENGAGIILSLADNSAFFFSTAYSELVDLMQQLRQKRGYLFSGFSDMSVTDVVAATGLPAEQATRAKQRLCSEPICWQDDERALQQFQQDLTKHNLQLLRGGRFYHLLSKEADKGTALRWLLANYPGKERCNWYSVALGDGPNDQSMLEAADLAVVIPSVTGISPEPRNIKVIHAEEPGPVGWNRSLLKILK